MTISPTPQSTAWHAVRAARNQSRWGRWSTLRYIQRNSVPHGLYTLARVLANAGRTL